MQSRISVLEYYDLFDIATDTTQVPPALTNDLKLDQVPTDIKVDYVTNPFRGFSNNAVYPNTAYDNVVVTGKHKAAHAITSIHIEDNGDVLCYPPNVSVPYWSKVVFRCFDYQYTPHKVNGADSALNPILNNYQNVGTYEPAYVFYDVGTATNYVVPPEYYGKQDTTASWPAPFTSADFTGIPANGVQLPIYDGNYSNAPLFLKFDQYQSRTKVIFSGCDKNYAHDVEFKFGYQHGQMQPLKMNLSLTCNTPLTDITNPTTKHWNYNLNKDDINKLLVKCYWSVEWIYEPDMH